MIEVSGCDVIDLGEFSELQKLVRTMEWLGLRCVVAGLRPGIVAYLASAGISAGSLRTSLDLELALQELKPSDEPEPEPEPDNDEPDHEYDNEPDDARPLLDRLGQGRGEVRRVALSELGNRVDAGDLEQVGEL